MKSPHHENIESSGENGRTGERENKRAMSAGRVVEQQKTIYTKKVVIGDGIG